VETKEDRDKIPADIRDRYEKLQQDDLPAVAPETDADEEDVDDEDDDDDADADSAAPLTETVYAPSCFLWCAITSGRGVLS
jgi:hypothetical protein